MRTGGKLMYMLFYQREIQADMWQPICYAEQLARLSRIAARLRQHLPGKIRISRFTPDQLGYWQRDRDTPYRFCLKSE